MRNLWLLLLEFCQWKINRFCPLVRCSICTNKKKKKLFSWPPFCDSMSFFQPGSSALISDQLSQALERPPSSAWVPWSSVFFSPLTADFQNDKIHPHVLISYSSISRLVTPWSPPLCLDSLLILPGDWSSGNLRRTLTDGHQLFFFRLVLLSRGDEVILQVTLPDWDQLEEQ